MNICTKFYLIFCVSLFVNTNIFSLRIATHRITINGVVHIGPRISGDSSLIKGSDRPCIATGNLIACNSGKIFETVKKDEGKGEKCPPNTFLGRIPYMERRGFSYNIYCSVKQMGKDEESKMIELPQGKYKILEASYGAGNTMKDVTEILKNKYSDKAFTFKGVPFSMNKLFGDPTPGIRKNLIIKYMTPDGKENTKTIAEDESFSIP